MIPRPACSCHGWAACVHLGCAPLHPGGQDAARGWAWHCPLAGCEGYGSRLAVLHEWVLADLAEEQRKNAGRLLAAVRKASDAGLSWRDIGEALGIDAAMAFRYVKAGSPVSVLRPFLRADSPRAKAARISEGSEGRSPDGAPD